MIDFLCQHCRFEGRAFDEQLHAAVQCTHCKAMTAVYPKPGQSAPGMPPKFQVTGRTDFEHMTPTSEEARERSQRALDEGYSSGFSRVTPGGMTIMRGDPPLPESRQHLASLTASGAYLAWFERLRLDRGLAKSALIFAAIGLYATVQGFTEEPPER